MSFVRTQINIEAYRAVKLPRQTATNNLVKLANESTKKQRPSYTTGQIDPVRIKDIQPRILIWLENAIK